MDSATACDGLAELRARFPGWSVFRSAGDEAQFYATPHREPHHGGYAFTLAAETADGLAEQVAKREPAGGLAGRRDGPQQPAAVPAVAAGGGQASGEPAGLGAGFPGGADGLVERDLGDLGGEVADRGAAGVAGGAVLGGGQDREAELTPPGTGLSCGQRQY